MADGTEFSTTAVLGIEVPDREVKAAREKIETGIGSVSATIENGTATTPGASASSMLADGGGFGTLVNLQEEQVDLTEDLLDEVENMNGFGSGGFGGGGSGGGGGFDLLSFLAGRGLGGGGGGGLGNIGLLGRLAGGLTTLGLAATKTEMAGGTTETIPEDPQNPGPVNEFIADGVRGGIEATSGVTNTATTAAEDARSGADVGGTGTAGATTTDSDVSIDQELLDAVTGKTTVTPAEPDWLSRLLGIQNLSIPEPNWFGEFQQYLQDQGESEGYQPTPGFQPVPEAGGSGATLRQQYLQDQDGSGGYQPTSGYRGVSDAGGSGATLRQQYLQDQGGSSPNKAKEDKLRRSSQVEVKNDVTINLKNLDRELDRYFKNLKREIKREIERDVTTKTRR